MSLAFPRLVLGRPAVLWVGKMNLSRKCALPWSAFYIPNAL